MKRKTAAIVDFIKQNNNYLLTTHINADGDAYGSMLACSLWLEKLGKKYQMLLDDPKRDSKYRFLKNWDKIESLKQNEISNLKGKFDTLLIFDAPGNRRIGSIAELVTEHTKCLKIDHHPVEDEYGELDWVDMHASSVASMVFEVIENSAVQIDEAIATALYTGIIFDTGRLSYSNTRARDFEICSILTSCGADPGYVTNHMFFSNKLKSLHTIGNGLKSIKLYNEGKVSIIYLANGDLQDVEPSDLESLATFSLSIRGVEVGAYIREIETGFFKISLRSKEYVNVNEIAQKFNGGGHNKAAGCSYNGSYEDLLSKMILHIGEKIM